MTFADFKILCITKKDGAITLPISHEEHKIVLKEALTSIATFPNLTPLKLVTNDRRHEVLRPINQTKFIRVPELPENDEDEIDIDETLTYAVLYEMLGNLTTDVSKYGFYEMKRDTFINNYNWNNYNLLQELNNEQ